MPPAINEWLGRTRAEWDANPRLKLGTGLIALIMLIGLHQTLDNWRQAHADAAYSAAQELRDLQQTATEQQWPERAKKINEQYETLKTRLWPATSDGAVQAAVRDFIQAEARKHGVEIQRTNLRSIAPPRGSQHSSVRIELQGTYQPLTWQRFIAALEDHRPALIIESERIDRSIPQRPRYQLSITTWYQLPGPQGAQQ